MSFSDKKLKTISQDVYQTDFKLHRKQFPKTGKVYHNYYALKVKDTKDAEENGFQGMAVVPLDKNGKPDYSQITIAFAGTGDAKKGANNYFPGVGKDSLDVQEDLQGIGQGKRDKLQIVN